ncbi:DUF4421 domain-containing protein [Algoriphagus zhangzhouensis]|uniref:DUF4421 domain-containing protein n=1 Tax=Algoriphagus zhangzhouensis TaxID=1073327 RepID=A0A1M7Z945_9BACT|nr:DUF4421 domain-containing protein [Algoriphagus zhangzhouensis]TDY47563.1 uncharacterized protein DUF4421 [Algoriphagus zhangzhouensis]SHO61290.1 protein of unknown function [Algoriphagus zhangzhouensis]
MRLRIGLGLLGVIFFMNVSNLRAQKSSFDSNYVEEHPELLGLRFYFSKKYTNLVVYVPKETRRYVFEPNSGNNLGVGFTYQRFTLNLAMPLGFMNPNRQQNWPFYLDLQSHVYPKKMIIDLFGQFYNGYTLSADQLNNSSESYLREDLKLRQYGVNFNYLFNGDKISVQASFNQSMIQKRSAFSPFLGFEMYGGSMRGDSLLIPTTEAQTELNFQRAKYFQAGPNVGFAGTLVFGKGFYLTGVASANLSVGFADWENDTQSFRKVGVISTYFLRGFAGYNSERFSINANYIFKNVELVRDGPFEQAVNTGNYRINLVYKLSVSEKFRQKFRKINPIRLINKDL